MHIAMLAAAPAESHGWGRYVRSLVTALAPHNVEITLMTSADAPPDPGLAVRGYHRVLPSLVPAPRFSTFRLLSAIPAVRRLVSSCDALHITAEPYALAALALRKPTLVTAHGTYLPATARRRGIGLLYRAVYQHAHILCVSGYTERRVRAVLPHARTRVIFNGVDVERYRLAPAQLPHKRGPTILAVGQIKPRKGFHILAVAMRTIREAIPDAEAIFIGNAEADPPYTASIKAQLAADGLADAVRWPGRVPEEVLLGWFHAADVFALPALNVGDRFEGFGLVYLEASAAGLPVVGTRDCGAEDAIRDGETGLLVPQNDPQAVAQAVIRLLGDSALRQQFGTAGVAWAGQHTWAQVAGRVLALYRSLLS